MANITDPRDVVPKGLPEKKVPAVKTEPLLKVIAPGSAPVRRCPVAAVEEKVIFPLMLAVAVVAREMVIALAAFIFKVQPAGISRSVPVTPKIVSMETAAL